MTAAELEVIEEVSRYSVRAQGCRCDVEITVGEIVGNHARIEAAHDDWCPLLLATRSQSN